MEKTHVLCECNSWECRQSIQLPTEVALEISRKGYVVIVAGCKNGPSSTDKLIEQRDGYALYQEQ